EQNQRQSEQPTGSEGSFGRQDSSASGASGQPIGGHDSNSGSGTTMNQGSDLGQGSSSDQSSANVGADTLTTDHGSSAKGQDGGLGGRSQGQSGGGSEGEGFIGSQGAGSDDYLQERGGSGTGSACEAARGSDF